MAAFLPSTYPNSPRPRRKAAIRCGMAAGDSECSSPMTWGLLRGCAHANPVGASDDRANKQTRRRRGVRKLRVSRCAYACFAERGDMCRGRLDGRKQDQSKSCPLGLSSQDPSNVAGCYQAATRPARRDNANSEARPVSTKLDSESSWCMLLIFPAGSVWRPTKAGIRDRPLLAGLRHSTADTTCR